MIKKSICIVFIFCSTAFAVESRLSNGKIEFAISDVGGQVCWTQKEKDDAISEADIFKATSPVTVTNFTPTEAEVNLSTCVLSFANYGEYRACVRGDKDVIEDKIRDLRRAIDDRSDLPVARLRPFLARISWLKTYYQGLP